MKMDFIYHVGHLAVDRNVRVSGFDGPLTEAAEAVEEVAARMMNAATRGMVVLYQKRRRSGYGFEYHCVPVRGA